MWRGKSAVVLVVVWTTTACLHTVPLNDSGDDDDDSTVAPVSAEGYTPRWGAIDIFWTNPPGIDGVEVRRLDTGDLLQSTLAEAAIVTTDPKSNVLVDVQLTAFVGTVYATPVVVNARTVLSGDLDPDFGTDGVYVDDFVLYPSSRGFDVGIDAFTAGEPIVVGGEATDTGTVGALWRLTSSGTPDTSWDCGMMCDTDAVPHAAGFVPYYSTPTDDLAGVRRVRVRSTDGKVYAVGSAPTTDRNFTTFRYNPTGELDSGFANNGQAVSMGANNADDWASDVTLRGTNVFVAGYVDEGGTELLNGLIRKLTNNGNGDGSFSFGGSIDIPGSTDSECTAVAVGADGRVYTAIDFGTSTQLWIFSTSGIESGGSRQQIVGNGFVSAMEYNAPADDFLIAGASQGTARLWRHQTNGNPDGELLGTLAISGVANDVFIDEVNDYVYVTGSQSDGSLFLLRLDGSTLTLDTKFAGGVVTLPNAIGQGVDVDSEGRIVVAGTATSSGTKMAAWRFVP